MKNSSSLLRILSIGIILTLASCSDDSDTKKDTSPQKPSKATASDSKKERAKKLKMQQDLLNALLLRCESINSHGIQHLADAKEKKLDVTCTPIEAQLLLSIIIKPNAKDEQGKQLYGDDPERVAKNAIVLLALAAENDHDITKLIFKQLGENASKISPPLFHSLLAQLVSADLSNINKQLSKLSNDILTQPPSKEKSEILSSVWEAKGQRTTAEDIPDMLKLLSSKDLDKKLARTLSICLNNIIMKMDDANKKQEVGDKIFDTLPEEFRSQLIFTVAAARSSKARVYYEKRMEDKNNWHTDISFFSNWGDDSVIPYLVELQKKASDEQEKRTIRGALATIFSQNRERDDATVKLLLDAIYDKLDQDSSDWESVFNKTEPNSTGFIGKDSPEYAPLMERRKELETIRMQKLSLLRALGRFQPYPWVHTLIERFENDSDVEISKIAKTTKQRLRRASGN